jgi:hypothetical protein
MAVAAVLSWCVTSAPIDAGSVQSDLDELMGRVLQRRDENWKKLQQYVLDEDEQLVLSGSGGARLWGERREYTWYIRDGFFVRSPLTVNGATVGDGDRLKYEDEFLKRAKGRDAAGRGAGAAGRAGAEAAAEPQAGATPASSVEGILAQTRQPQFIDSAYFLRFKFEPGHYALVGQETLADRRVLRIEYYPARLFSHEQDAESRRRTEGRSDRKEDSESLTERAVNKASLVTLWVDPSIAQIVKYTFDNVVDFDFMPAAWFVRIDDLKATMNMVEPFPSVWLPAHVMMRFGLLTAAGPVVLQYDLDYHDYREPKASGRFSIQGAPQ